VNKLSMFFFMAVAVITAASIGAMQYGQQQPYGQQPYGQQYGQQPYGQQQYGQQYGHHQCSQQALHYKYQKNLMQCHQQMAACQQGHTEYCKKAQEDCQDAQKYAMELQQCPYP
jgi:hypothetical protein